MKYVLMMFALLSTAAIAYAQSPVAVLSAEAAGQWDKTTHEFGTMRQHNPQSAVFTFTNRSIKPVLITKAVGSCGCTVASYTEEAIAPGAEGTVRATYNAAKPGAFSKTVTVTTSADNAPQILRIQGTVVE